MEDYNDMQDVVDRLARIETKVDALSARRDDHETRVRWLERKYWLAAGGGAVVVFALAKMIPELVK